MSSRQLGTALLALVLMTGLAAGAGRRLADEDAARAYFGNIELVDQEGRGVRLYDDLLKDRVVVISSFFTRCQGICPVLNAKLAALQERLGQRMGRDVFFLSLTVDPEHDTPEVIAEYAKRWQAGPGWRFLSGPPEQVKAALRKLGQHVDVKEAHTTVLIMGNERTGLWKKANGVATPATLLEIVESLINDRGA